MIEYFLVAGLMLSWLVGYPFIGEWIMRKRGIWKPEENAPAYFLYGFILYPLIPLSIIIIIGMVIWK